MRTLSKIFADHPSAVGETYFQHLRMASAFGLRMVSGGLACLIHGLLPFLFEKTGSTQIRYLHDRMVANRNAAEARRLLDDRQVLGKVVVER